MDLTDGRQSTTMDGMSDDPMHINNVRARHVADEAERDMYRAIDREIDSRPANTPFGMLRRALADNADSGTKDGAS